MTTNPEAGEQERLAEIRRSICPDCERPDSHSIRDLLRWLDARDARIATLTDALKAACGYLTNAMIDLETGAPKRTALATIKGGLNLVRAALAAPAAAETGNRTMALDIEAIESRIAQLRFEDYGTFSKALAEDAAALLVERAELIEALEHISTGGCGRAGCREGPGCYAADVAGRVLARARGEVEPT